MIGFLNTNWAIIKLVFASLFILGMMLVFGFLFLFLSKKIIAKLVYVWSYLIVRVAGGRIVVQGKLPDYHQPNSLVVSNHITWLDIPVLLHVCCVNFIANEKIKKWFFVGKVFTQVGAIFIGSGKNRDLNLINKTIANALSNGASLGLFPEGHTTAGDGIDTFKASVFEAAKIANSRITPVTINYYDKKNQRINVSHHVTFHKKTLFGSALSMLKLNGFKIVVTCLDSFSSEGYHDRYSINGHVHGLIQHAYDANIAKCINYKI